MSPKSRKSLQRLLLLQSSLNQFHDHSLLHIARQVLVPEMMLH
jgi:hypothetical protein